MTGDYIIEVRQEVEGPWRVYLVGSDKPLAEKGGNWEYEDLNAFLAKPSAFIKGTKMAFAGIGNAKERADIIAWLRTQHPSPPALPQ